MPSEAPARGVTKVFEGGSAQARLRVQVVCLAWFRQTGQLKLLCGELVASGSWAADTRLVLGPFMPYASSSGVACRQLSASQVAWASCMSYLPCMASAGTTCRRASSCGLLPHPSRRRAAAAACRRCLLLLGVVGGLLLSQGVEASAQHGHHAANPVHHCRWMGSGGRQKGMGH